MPAEHGIVRAVGWAAVILLGLTLARESCGSGAEVAVLRARERHLCQRFDDYSNAFSIEAQRAGSDERQDEPSELPQVVRVIEELRLVRCRIAELESNWW